MLRDFNSLIRSGRDRAMNNEYARSLMRMVESVSGQPFPTDPFPAIITGKATPQHTKRPFPNQRLKDPYPSCTEPPQHADCHSADLDPVQTSSAGTTSGASDAQGDEGQHSVSTSINELGVGRFLGQEVSLFLRFPDNIPQGADIEAVRLKGFWKRQAVNAAGPGTYSLRSIVGPGLAGDNCPVFTSGLSSTFPANATLTSVYGAFTFPTPPIVVNDPVLFSDLFIKTAYIAFRSRPGWAQGNFWGIKIQGSTPNLHAYFFKSFESAAVVGVFQLEIDWRPAGSLLTMQTTIDANGFYSDVQLPCKVWPVRYRWKSDHLRLDSEMCGYRKDENDDWHPWRHAMYAINTYHVNSQDQKLDYPYVRPGTPVIMAFGKTGAITTPADTPEYGFFFQHMMDQTFGSRACDQTPDPTFVCCHYLNNGNSQFQCMVPSDCLALNGIPVDNINCPNQPACGT